MNTPHRSGDFTVDELLVMAGKEGPLSREDIGIQMHGTSDGMQIMTEGFNFFQPNDHPKFEVAYQRQGKRLAPNPASVSRKEKGRIEKDTSR